MAEPAQGDWEGGWKAHRRRQLLACLSATPAQRLAWLEEAQALAYQAGALPAARIPPKK